MKRYCEPEKDRHYIAARATSCECGKVAPKGKAFKPDRKGDLR